MKEFCGPVELAFPLLGGKRAAFSHMLVAMNAQSFILHFRWDSKRIFGSRLRDGNEARGESLERRQAGNLRHYHGLFLLGASGADGRITAQ